MAVFSKDDGYEPPNNLFMIKGDSDTWVQSPLLISEANTHSDPTFGGLSSSPDEIGPKSSRLLTVIAENEEARTAFGSSTTSFVALPYLPYFSDCDYYGAMMYIPSVFETNPNCTFYSPNKTIPIFVTGFGQKATADICTDLTFQCRYTENITQLSTRNYWFKAKFGDTLFSFYEYPVTADALSTLLNGETNISPEVFVPIVVSSFSEEGKIPTTVVITLEYYQINTEQKKLIRASAGFSGFIDPKNETSTVYNYTLILNWNPLSYTELTIEFALPWYVYLTMYIVVCTLTVMMTIVFMIYHKLVSRFKTKFYFWSYLKVYLNPSLLGLLYVMLPQLLYILIIAVVFSHHIMDYRLQRFFCVESDDSCLLRTIWDRFYFKEETPMTDEISLSYQKARIGLLLIHTGFWIHWRNAQLCAPNIKSEGLTHGGDTAYDKNVWYKNLWRRANYIYISMLLIAFELFHIHFSFTALFSNNIWYFIIFFKLVGITVENVCEQYIQDKLMMASISSTIPLMENLTTFGATNFLDFIGSYVVGFGMMLVERVYVIPSTDIIVDKVLEYQLKIKEYLRKVFIRQEDDLFEEEEEEEGEAAQREGEARDEAAGGERADSKCSDILITENSYEQELFDKYRKNLGQFEDDNHHSESFVSDSENVSEEDQSPNNKRQTMEDRINYFLEKVDLRGDSDVFEEQVKMKIEKQSKQKGKIIKEEEENQNENIQASEESGSTIESYYNYTVEIVSFFYAPFLNWIIWQFYDETTIFDKWGIRRKDIFFYILFSAIILPFQIIIDIFFFNTMSSFLNVDYLKGLKIWKKRFAESTFFWRGYNREDNELDYKIRKLDLLCYSSQFYFIAYLGCSGHLILLIGIMSMIESNLFPWEDSFFWLFIIINQIIILFVEWVTFKVRHLLGIWNIEEKRKEQKKNIDDKDKFSNHLDENLEIENLAIIDLMRNREQQIMKILKRLQKQDFPSNAYKEEFLSSNVQWLGDNIRMIMTPKTVLKNRNILLDRLSEIIGNPKPLAEMKDTEPANKYGNILDLKEKERIKNSLKPEFVQIFGVWMSRARRLIKIRSQIAGILEYYTEPSCNFCGRSWGLKCESISSIEVAFNNFLRKVPGQNYLNWDLIAWQRYYSENSKFRTLCYSCYEEILPKNLHLR